MSKARRGGALHTYPKGKEVGPDGSVRVRAAVAISRLVGRASVRRSLIAVGAVTAVLLLLPTPSAAMNRTMDVMIFAPDREYGIGEAVTVTAHVFDSGVHEDATTLSVNVGPKSSAREVVPRRIDTGVYEPTFQVLQEDVVEGFVRIAVQATVGTMWDQEVRFLRVESLEVEVTASSPRAVPGAAVGITVRVHENGVPRDPDWILIVANLVTLGDASPPAELGWTRTGVGTYLSAYEVPWTVAQNTALALSAIAEVDGASAQGQVVVLVEASTDLVVWYHKVAVGPEDAELEILAADKAGSPERGAEVSLTLAYFDAVLTFVTRTASGPTDERGVAAFHLDYQGARSDIDFWGTVTAGSASQGFAGSLGMPMIPPRQMDVWRDNALAVFTPGERGTLEYTVFRRGTPVPFLTLHYYGRTDQAIVTSGIAVSDASGRFALPFVAPIGVTTIEFAFQVDGVWVYDTDFVLSAARLEVQLGELFAGGITSVSASFPTGFGPWIAFVTFRPYVAGRDAGGLPWALASGAWGVSDIVISTGERIRYDLVVPRFLPKGVDYVLSIVAFPQGGSEGAMDLYVYQEMFRIENRRPTVSVQVPSHAVTTGSIVEVDASASFDQDGDVVAAEIEWGDGTSTGWTVNLTATHAYDRAGDYQIVVRIRDDDGAIGEAWHALHVDVAVAETPPVVLLVLVIGLFCGVGATLPLAARRVRRRPVPTAS